MSLLQDAISKYSKLSTTAKAGVIASGAGLIVGGTAYALSKRRKSKSRNKVKNRKSKNTGNTRRKKRTVKQKKPYTAGKRRDTSRRRIRYTSNNQPYIILASGKARFIKKKSVSLSRKRKGGKY